MNTKTKSIQEVLNQFGSFQKNWHADRLAGIQSLITQTKPQLILLRQQADIWERENAPRYSIFSLLGLQQDEVKTHTPFLRDLLDPQGMHSQSHLFLQAFLDKCQGMEDQLGGRFPTLPDHHNIGRWRVRSERRLTFIDPHLYGRIDIVITNKELGFLMVLENKIGSPEQPDQLYRYSVWMDERKSSYRHQALIYLTPDGSPSRTNRGRPYFALSYRDDIHDWIDVLVQRKSIKPVNVRTILQQYLQILRTL